MPQLFRIEFAQSDFLKLPEQERVFCVSLAQVADDLRHISYLCVTAERGVGSTDADERKLAVHQLMFGVRLIYSVLYEGWQVIDKGWNGQMLGRTWDSRLSDEARSSLAYLGRYMARDNLCRTVRDNFGFHYLPEPLREVVNAASNHPREIISGRHSANVFYPFAEEMRSLAIVQATLPKDAPRLSADTTSKEYLRDAVIKLYESYRPVLEKFEAFANCVLIEVIKSLPYATRSFIPPKVTKFAEMRPVLFVEEPGD